MKIVRGLGKWIVRHKTHGFEWGKKEVLTMISTHGILVLNQHYGPTYRSYATTDTDFKSDH